MVSPCAETNNILQTTSPHYYCCCALLICCFLANLKKTKRDDFTANAQQQHQHIYRLAIRDMMHTQSVCFMCVFWLLQKRASRGTAASSSSAFRAKHLWLSDRYAWHASTIDNRTQNERTNEPIIANARRHRKSQTNFARPETRHHAIVQSIL